MSFYFKLKNRSLENHKKAYFMKKAFFSGYFKKIAQNLYFSARTPEKCTRNLELYFNFLGKHVDFMQSALQNREIICCVQIRVHNHILKFN